MCLFIAEIIPKKVLGRDILAQQQKQHNVDKSDEEDGDEDDEEQGEEQGEGEGDSSEEAMNGENHNHTES